MRSQAQGSKHVLKANSNLSIFAYLHAIKCQESALATSLYGIGMMLLRKKCQRGFIRGLQIGAFWTFPAWMPPTWQFSSFGFLDSNL
eukprot:1161286-Pelagomonas_calceolata.AAC.5